MLYTTLENWLKTNPEEKLYDVYMVDDYAKGFTPPRMMCAEIVEAITLPNKEVLLGFKLVGKRGNKKVESITYYNLKDIRLVDQTVEYIRQMNEQEQNKSEVEDGEEERS